MLWYFQVNSEGTQPYIHVSTLPWTPLPSRLPHNNEQSSMCYTAWTKAFYPLYWSPYWVRVKLMENKCTGDWECQRSTHPNFPWLSLTWQHLDTGERSGVESLWVWVTLPALWLYRLFFSEPHVLMCEIGNSNFYLVRLVWD